jgi:hypothetical protein
MSKLTFAYRLATDLTQHTETAKPIVQQISSMLVTTATITVAQPHIEEFFSAVFAILSSQMPELHHNFRYTLDILNLLESRPIQSGTLVATLLLQLLPPSVQLLVSPFVKSGAFEGETNLLVEFAVAARHTIEKSATSAQLDPLAASPILNISEAATLLAQFFVEHPNNWANLVAQVLQYLTFALLRDLRASSKVAQGFLHLMGETLLEQINNPIISNYILETMQHSIFVMEVGDAGASSAHCNKIRLRIADLTFHTLLPGILKEVLDLIISLPPQKATPNISDQFLQTVVDKLDTLLEDSPFFILSKLIGRAKDTIFTSSSARVSQYTSIVFASIRDRIMDAVQSTNPLEDDQWLFDLVAVVDTNGKQTNQILRLVLSHFDLGRILSIVTHELIRCLMFPHQLVVAGIMREAIHPFLRHPELIVGVQDMLLSSARSTLWPALIQSVEQAFPSRNEVASLVESVLQVQIKDTLFPIMLEWDISEGQECNIITWYNSFTVPMDLKIAVATALRKKMFKFMEHLESTLAKPPQTKLEPNQSAPITSSFVVMKAFFNVLVGLKSGNSANKARLELLGDINKLLDVTNMHEELCAVIVQILIKPLVKYICFTLPAELWERGQQAVRESSASEEEVLSQMCNDPPFQMFKRYTTPLRDALYPAFRSFVRMVVNPMDPNMQHSHMCSLLQVVLSQLAGTTSFSQIPLHIYIKEMKQKVDQLSPEQCFSMFRSLAPVFTKVFEPLPSAENAFYSKLHAFVRLSLGDIIPSVPDTIMVGYAKELCNLVFALGEHITEGESTQVFHSSVSGPNMHQIAAELFLRAVEGAGNNPSTSPLFSFIYSIAKIFVRPVVDLVEKASSSEANMELLRSFSNRSAQFFLFAKHFSTLLSYHIVHCFQQLPIPTSSPLNKGHSVTRCWGEFFLQHVLEQVFYFFL